MKEEDEELGFEDDPYNAAYIMFGKETKGLNPFLQSKTQDLRRKMELLTSGNRPLIN